MKRHVIKIILKWIVTEVFHTTIDIFPLYLWVTSENGCIKRTLNYCFVDSVRNLYRSGWFVCNQYVKHTPMMPNTNQLTRHISFHVQFCGSNVAVSRPLFATRLMVIDFRQAGKQIHKYESLYIWEYCTHVLEILSNGKRNIFVPLSRICICMIYIFYHAIIS